MGWWNDLKNSVTETFNEAASVVSDAASTALDYAGTAADAVIHTTAVVVDGIEEGVGTLGGLVVGGVGDLANGAVRLTGDGLSALGVDGAEDWELYEGGFGTGISTVSSAITEGIDDAQAFLIDKPVNWALDAVGSEYEFQYARPPLRNDFDKWVFGTAKTGTEVVGGIALVALTGGAAGAIGLGSATAGGLMTSAVTGTGLYITAAGTTYSLYQNINDQYTREEQEVELYDALFDAAYGAQQNQTGADVTITEPSPIPAVDMDAMFNRAYGNRAPTPAMATP